MDDVVLRLSQKSQPLAIWYTKVLKSKNVIATTVAKAAIRAYARNEIFYLAEVNLTDPYEVKAFRIRFDDEKDADIIQYLNSMAAASNRKIKEIIRGILLASIKQTSGPTKISMLGDAIYAGLDYSMGTIGGVLDAGPRVEVNICRTVEPVQKATPDIRKPEEVEEQKSSSQNKTTDNNTPRSNAWAGYGLK